MFIFVCYAIPNSMVNQNKAVSVPGNKQALLLAELFQSFFKDEFVCVTIPPRQASFKDFKKKSILQSQDIITGAETHEVRYLNLPIVKEYSIRYNLKRILNDILNKSKNGDDIVMTVNSNGCVSVPLLQLKKKYKFKTSIYLSDMPFDENPTRNIVKKVLLEHDNRIRVNNLRYYDSVIAGVDLLIEMYFKNKVSIKIDPAIEFEKYKIIDSVHTKESQCINIVYTGSLNENYHIPELVEVVKLLPVNYTITFYGRGPYTEFVIEQGKKCNRVKYGGYLPFDEIVKVQMNADLLIALLDTSKNISKYAVPSKVFDYLCAGVPVVSSNALSLSNDLKKYVTLVDDMDMSDIKNKILNIFADDEHIAQAIEKAQAGKRYVTKNCRWDVQQERILSFLREISNG